MASSTKKSRGTLSLVWLRLSLRPRDAGTASNGSASAIPEVRSNCLLTQGRCPDACSLKQSLRQGITAFILATEPPTIAWCGIEARGIVRGLRGVFSEGS